ncbi:MAG: hypothetical protein IT438_04045 [Phycisphaerales bacterium]|nr:hypothetical protein [Phycisphaerales bacterium]
MQRTLATSVLLVCFCSLAPADTILLSSGGSIASSGPVTMHLSIGQPVIGLTASPPITARLGFWHAAGNGGCAADFNNSGAVSVQDIFDFLAAYFSNDPRADFNNSGAISVQDIFDYLAAYFTGC